MVTRYLISYISSYKGDAYAWGYPSTGGTWAESDGILNNVDVPAMYTYLRTEDDYQSVYASNYFGWTQLDTWDLHTNLDSGYGLGNVHMDSYADSKMAFTRASYAEDTTITESLYSMGKFADLAKYNAAEGGAYIDDAGNSILW